MKTKIIIVVVTVVSLLTCLCVPTFASEVTTAPSEEPSIWSNVYVSGFGNTVTASRTDSAANGVFGGFYAWRNYNDSNPYVGAASNSLSFNSETGSLSVRYIDGVNRAVLVLSGAHVTSVNSNVTNKPGSYTVMTKAEITAPGALFADGMTLRTSDGTRYTVSVADMPSTASYVVWTSNAGGGSDTNHLDFTIASDTVEPSFEATMNLTSSTFSFFTASAVGVLSFVSNSWAVLLPLIMWLTVAVIGAIKRFTSKG